MASTGGSDEEEAGTLKLGIISRSLLALTVVLGLGGCSTGSPDDPFAALFSLRGEQMLRVLSHGGNENQSEAMLALLNRAMVSAQSTIYCSFQNVNAPGVVTALRDHHNRGIDVRVGIDEDYKDGIGYRLLKRFLNDNPALGTQKLFSGNGGSGEVHQNLCVADGTKVWLSSVAPMIPELYTETGFALYIQTDDDGLARKFAVEMDLVTHGSFGSAKQRLNRRNHWLVDGVDVGVYMAPAESPLANFLTPRLQVARQGVRIFSSEFFANKLASSSSATGKVRVAGDIAYDTMAGSAAFKEAIGSDSTFHRKDPEEKNDLNSIKYLRSLNLPNLFIRAGGSPDNGMSIILLDDTGAAFGPGRSNNAPQAFLMTHPLSTRADSSHDGIMMVFEDNALIQEITAFYNAIRQRSHRESSIGKTGLDITTANQREVVISELNWAGGYSKTGSSATARDYIELYNNTSSTLNISRWRVDCGNAGGFASNILVLPDKVLIEPGQYFVVDRSSNTFIAKSNLTLTSTAVGAECNSGNSGTCAGTFATIATTFDQCRLTDADATVVDVIGVSGTAFDTDNVHFGLNDTSGQNRRSMERKVLSTDGTLASNWHTNANTWVTNYNLKPDYIDKTFGTPGYANSPDGLSLQSATATSLTAVSAVFSSPPEPGAASLAANYCIGLSTDTTSCSNVVAVTAATVSGSTVTLTTGTQTKAALYKLFVTNVTSSAGAALLSGTATFTGFFVQATIVINEVAPSQTTNDLVELYVVSSGSLLGYTLYEGTGVTLMAFPDTTVTAGDYIVVHMGGSGTNETVSKTQSTDTGHYPAAWDFWSADSGLTATDNNINLRNAFGTVVDAVLYVNGVGGWTGSYHAEVVAAGQWVIAGGAFAESDGFLAATANGTSIQQIVDGSTNNNDNTKWQVGAESIGRRNGSPGVSPNPAVGATGIAVNANIVLTFTEAMNVGAGTVNLSGSSSGAQNGLTCTWTVGNTVCTIDPADFNQSETITVTLVGFLDAGDGLGPNLTSYTFQTINPGLVPSVTNVVVTSTNPNNGTTPYNTGTVTMTLTGTNFITGGTVTCPAGVRLDDLDGGGAAANTVAQSCTVNSDTQITATFPAGIRTNGSTGWNVIVTNGTGSNSTSSVKFVPRAGLLISEVVQNGAGGASSELIELYNPTGLPIDIGSSGINLRLQTRSSGGAPTNKTLTVIDGVARSDAGCTTNDTTIPSHGFYLIVSTGASGETWYAKRNMTFSAGMTGTGGASISLSSTAEAAIIDKVGWGTQSGGTPNYEGTALAGLGSSNSYERKPAGGGGHATDTDDNSADFNAQSTTFTPRYCLDAAQP